LGRCNADFALVEWPTRPISSWCPSGAAPGPLTEEGLDWSPAWLAGLSLTLGHIRVS
jgi:hypothetical protein